MNQQDKNLLNRIYDRHLKDSLPGLFGDALTATSIPDETRTLGSGIAALDTFLGACGIGFPTGDPSVELTGLGIADPKDITFGDLEFPGGDDLKFTVTIGTFTLNGNWAFYQDCFEAAPPDVNKQCATTNAVSMIASSRPGTANSADVDDSLAFLRQLRDDLQKSPKGREYLQVYNDNEEEVSNLLETNTAVKKAFTDQHGQQLLDTVLSKIEAQDKFPLASAEVDNALQVLGGALFDAGSDNLQMALLTAQQELPQYVGLSYDQIMAKIGSSQIKSATPIMAPVVRLVRLWRRLWRRPNQKRATASSAVPVMAPIQAQGADNGPLTRRSRSGSFSDKAETIKITISGTLGNLDNNNDQPPTYSVNTIEATIGKVSVDLADTTGGGSPTSFPDAIGALLSTFIGDTFGPGVTKNELLDNLTGADTRNRITTMVSDELKKYWG